MKKTTLIIITSALAIVALIGFRLASNKEKIDAQNKPTVNTNVAIPVTVNRVEEGTVSQQLIKTGNLIPFREATITATTAGKVTRVNFDLGTQVRQGQTLVELDNRLKELSLQATQLNIDKLKKDVNRYNTLLAGNATTEIQVNETKYNYENAVNQAEQIQKQIQDANVKAPISGQIVQKAIEPGVYITVGSTLGKVLDVARLKVDVLVNESDVYQLHKGQAVKVTADVFPGKVFSGQISYIAPQGTDEHNYPVEITISNANGLKAGTFVNVDFSQKSNQKALQIPRIALVESIKNPYVYVVENNVVHQRKITVGRDFGDTIEVLNGLSAGDVVVTTGQLNLGEGKPVQITK
ncbi:MULTISPECIES: efflux RND transporter periplasmic adaptor subunit [unclassified Spirosoma]|uniref:efflux RND transporter periplasmic adaptor subunit n=1 Tax=unclassified Spirosoma TaxID=2621999 RepID=UPI00095C0062|nr:MULTISPECIES: efflux RND transporter periplasmic adaptor subunit [unclassified Spirosoma]MBN8821409.1 efflux RND transporter periplasmic adaptor subunit [Spirosoma sp.]OJW78193.1 MAG: efflux transporter periplasmic adaptor subunit [Spirosoma sp. 48-14]